LTIETVSQERIRAVVKPFFNLELRKSLYELQEELEKKTN